MHGNKNNMHPLFCYNYIHDVLEESFEALEITICERRRTPPGHNPQGAERRDNERFAADMIDDTLDLLRSLIPHV
jgi:hypothetical protein